MDAIAVRDNPDAGRYEAWATDELVAFTEYEIRAGAHWMVHTEVTAKAQGAGVASKLVRAALDDLRSAGATIVPVCPYVASWVSRHREYGDLVDRDAWRSYKRELASERPSRRDRH